MSISNEVYSVDIHKNLLIYGRNDGDIIIQDSNNDEILKIINFSDESIIFIKADEKFFIAIAYDGKISKYSYEYKELETYEVNEDIESYYYKNNQLVVGTQSGVIYHFFDGLEFFKMFYGHVNSVEQVFFDGEIIYSLSVNDFIQFNCKTGDRIFELQSYNLLSFFILAPSVFLLSSEKNLRIFKGHKLLRKIDVANVNSFSRVSDQVICAGNGLFSISLENFNIYFYETNEYFSKVNIINNFLFAMMKDRLIICDYRKEIQYFEGGCGVIYDYSVGNGIILLGGENNIALIKMSE